MKKQIKTTSLDEMIDRHIGERGTPERNEFEEEILMEKTAQNLLNEKVAIALGEITDTLHDFAKNNRAMLKLVQFEGNRIDTLENKIDLLMTERGKAIVDWDSDLFKDEEEDIPEQLEEIHFDGYQFEVAPLDESEEMAWGRAIKFGNHDDGWRLPTIDELRLMYLSRERLGMKDGEYWSSSENGSNLAWLVYFDDGYAVSYDKDSSSKVRLVRTIEDE